jgi:hypothetical protein
VNVTATTAALTPGWLPGPPPHLAPWAESIDRGVCAESACEHCGNAGLDYRPEHCGRRYRAWAVCAGCGQATEF